MKTFLAQKADIATRVFQAAFAIVLAGTCSIAFANDELPKAEEIMDKHVESIGGKKALLSVKTRKMTGTFASDIAGHQLKAKIVIQAIAPDKSHLSIQSEIMSLVRVCDGKNAWEWNAGHNHREGEQESDSHLKESSQLMTGPDEKRTIEQAQFHANVNWRKRFKSVKNMGVAKVGEKPAYEIQVTSKSGEQHSQFYDQKSGRLVKTVRTVKSSAGEIKLETLIGNYREFDGIWVATKVEQFLKSPSFGDGTQTWNYSKIEHDAKISTKLFEMPAELKKQLK